MGLSPGEAATHRDWNALRERVDVAPLLASPPARALPTGPRIFAVDGFASASLCDWLVELGRPRLKPATTYDPATGVQRYESGRTNSDCHLVLPYSDLVLAAIRARIANAIALPLKFFEASTILHYVPSQEFAKHYDFLDDTLPGYAQEIAQSGQRVLTFLLYLNDGFEGGETDFPLAGVRYKGAKGDAVFFWNVTPDGALDRRTLHAGLPTTSGEKYLLSQWVRDRGVRDRAT
jgi:prolyl 4-hydroxylase